MMKRMFWLCFFISVLGRNSQVEGSPTVGSNTTSSRQKKTFFPAAHTNNKMIGFAVFENGLVLENKSTDCIFDAFFPLSGNLVLNGGTLHLDRDLVLKNPIKLGLGSVHGHGFALEFPRNISNLNVPSQYHNRLLTLVDSANIGDDVYSVDWSFDGKYVAAVSDTVSSISELQIFYFDGEVLTLTNSYNPGNRDIYTVNWHPSDHYLATGQYGDSELKIFHLDTATNTLTQTDTADVGSIYAVSWSRDGNYVAVGRSSSNTLLIYPVINGVLGTPVSGALGATRRVQLNALHWDSTNSYIAVGLENKVGVEELKVFSFDGTSLVENASLEIGSSVRAVRWHPSKPLLGVGKSSGAERFRMYMHDSVGGTLTEKVSARIGENRRVVYSVDWCGEGKYVLLSKSRDSVGHEVQVYSYSDVDGDLNLITGYEANDNVYSVRFSKGGSSNNLNVASGGRKNYLHVFNFSLDKYVFDNIKLFFNSDVMIRSPFEFTGTCIINGAGQTLNLEDSSAAFVISDGATLLLEDMIVKGISGSNIRCKSDTSTLILRDVIWLQDDDFTFTLGSMQFKNDVKMVGNGTFAYQTSQTSTILSKSQLKLSVGLTFSYDPTVVASKDLLEFEDVSSILRLDGATLHTTVTGLDLKKGTVLIERDSFLSSETQIVDATLIDEGITFGGSIFSDDIVVNLLSGVSLIVNQGSLRYKNILASSWDMTSDTSVVKMKIGTSFYLHENIDLSDGILSFADNTILARAIGKKVTGSVYTLGSVGFLNL